MSREKKFTISYRDAAAGFLILFNVFVVAPGGFALKTLLANYSEFEESTEKTLKDLNNKISDLHTKTAETYATQEELQSFREEIGQQLLSINTALISMSYEN